MLVPMQGLCLSGLTLAFSMLGVQALRTIHDETQRAQPMRTFIPQWMAKSKISAGMLLWETDTPQGTSYSQDSEDILAEAHYFHNLHNGTFLELGALDGTTFSNTRLFEEQRGWRGVLVEANRVEFEKIPQTRPEAIAVHAAICDRSQDVHFVSRRSQNEEPGSSGAVGGIWEFMAEGFQTLWYGTTVMPTDAEAVPCVTLGSILHTFGVTHIDFFSLDVEGAELQVLSTIDLSALHINVIVIEQDGRNATKDEAVGQKLLAHNFVHDESMKSTVAGARNEWFVNKRFKPSEARAS